MGDVADARGEREVQAVQPLVARGPLGERWPGHQLECGQQIGQAVVAANLGAGAQLAEKVSVD